MHWRGPDGGARLVVVTPNETSREKEKRKTLIWSAATPQLLHQVETGGFKLDLFF